MNRVEGKVAVVTGAAKGIGRATAELLAREGALVAATDVDADALREAVAGIEGGRGRRPGVGAGRDRRNGCRAGHLRGRRPLRTP